MAGNLSKTKGFGKQGQTGPPGPQGEQGRPGDVPKVVFAYDEETGDLYYKLDGIYMSSNDLITRIDSVDIKGGEQNWTLYNVYDAENNAIGKRYGQEVQIKNITHNSKIDLQLTPEQLVIFYEKDLSFVTENDNGEKVTIYCIGQIPQNDYTVQVIITEVVNNG